MYCITMVCVNNSDQALVWVFSSTFHGSFCRWELQVQAAQGDFSSIALESVLENVEISDNKTKGSSHFLVPMKAQKLFAAFKSVPRSNTVSIIKQVIQVLQNQQDFHSPADLSGLLSDRNPQPGDVPEWEGFISCNTTDH